MWLTFFPDASIDVPDWPQILLSHILYFQLKARILFNHILSFSSIMLYCKWSLTFLPQRKRNPGIKPSFCRWQSLLGRSRTLRCLWWLPSSYRKCTKSSPWLRYRCRSPLSQVFLLTGDALTATRTLTVFLIPCCTVYLMLVLQVYSIRTRARAVEIFTTCANLICAIEELEKVK